MSPANLISSLSTTMSARQFGATKLIPTHCLPYKDDWNEIIHLLTLLNSSTTLCIEFFRYKARGCTICHSTHQLKCRIIGATLEDFITRSCCAEGL